MAKEILFCDVTTAVCHSAARRDIELTMEEGQRLFLLENLDDDWVKVQVQTPFETFSGAEPADSLVPSTSIEPAPPLYRGVTLYDDEPNCNEATNAYLKEDEPVSVKIDREGTVSKPATGYVPASDVKNAEENKAVQYSSFGCGYGMSQLLVNLYAEEVEGHRGAAAAAVAPARRAEEIVAVVLYDFEAYADDELTVKKGERVTVLDKENDDWWKCCNLNGYGGVVPAAFLDIEFVDQAE